MRLRLVFFGSPEFAVPSLEAVASHHDVALVITQPDRPAGRGKKLAPPPVKEVAQRLGIPVEQPTTLKDPELPARLAALSADAFVVVAYGRILPQRLLDVPRLGPWNVHASLLPSLRGAAPIQWAIIRGERVTGVCIMRMEAGLDTGPVAARAELPIGDDDTAGALSPRLALVGASLLAQTLPRIARGEVQLQPQDDALATYAPILKKEDGSRRTRAASTRGQARRPTWRVSS
jgi:methionyl-tRNA formyltransferase